MDNVLEKHKFPKLTKETGNLTRSITSKEIKLVIKNFPTKKSPGPLSTMISIKYFKRKRYQFYTFSKKYRERKHFSTHSMSQKQPDTKARKIYHKETADQ